MPGEATPPPVIALNPIWRADKFSIIYQSYFFLFRFILPSSFIPPPSSCFVILLLSFNSLLRFNIIFHSICLIIPLRNVGCCSPIWRRAGSESFCSSIPTREINSIAQMAAIFDPEGS